MTLKKVDSIPDFDKMAKEVINLLKKSYGFIDEPEECSRSIKQYIDNYTDTPEESERALKDISVKVFGNDFPKTVEQLEDFILVGDQIGKTDDVCNNCGYPQLNYNGETRICPVCDHIMYDDEDNRTFEEQEGYKPYDFFNDLGRILNPN